MSLTNRPDWRDVDDDSGIVRSLAYGLRTLPEPYATSLSEVIRSGTAIEAEDIADVMRDNLDTLLVPWFDYARAGLVSEQITNGRLGSALARAWLRDAAAHQRSKAVRDIGYWMGRFAEHRHDKVVEIAVRTAVLTTNACGLYPSDDALAAPAGLGVEREAVDILVAGYFAIDTGRPYVILNDSHAYYGDLISAFTASDDEYRDLLHRQRVEVLRVFALLVAG